MPVELRKRKAPAPPPEPPAKKQSKLAKAAAKVKEAIKPRGRPPKAAAAAATAVPAAAATNGSSAGKPEVGEVIELDGFGGEIETNDGTKTTLKALVDESKAGVVLFTYPKASTPGCTIQACLFRDSYEPLTAGGLAIYGLSADSPKLNTTFKEKQRLPYPLLCDQSATLIGAIGLKKAPKGTTRGVFVVDKAGKVLAAEAGGPEGTVAVVKKIVAELTGPGDAPAAPAAAADPPAAEPAPAAPAESDPPAAAPAAVEAVPEPAAEEAEKKKDEPVAPAAPAAPVVPIIEEKPLPAAPAPAADPAPPAEEAAVEKKDVEMADAPAPVPNGDVKAAEEAKPEGEKKDE